MLKNKNHRTNLKCNKLKILFKDEAEKPLRNQNKKTKQVQKVQQSNYRLAETKKGNYEGIQKTSSELKDMSPA